MKDTAEREAVAQAFWQLFLQTLAPTGDLRLALPSVFLRSHIWLKVADEPQNCVLSFFLSSSLCLGVCVCVLYVDLLVWDNTAQGYRFKP